MVNSFFNDMTIDADLLPHVVDIHHQIESNPDDGGGLVSGTTAAGDGVVLLAQPALVINTTSEDMDRWTDENISDSYDVYLNPQTSVRPRDFIYWTDSTGVAHTIVVQYQSDSGGFGMGLFFKIKGYEYN